MVMLPSVLTGADKVNVETLSIDLELRIVNRELTVTKETIK